MRVLGKTALDLLDSIDGANLATNLVQLEVMQRQMEHDRRLHDEYYSTIVQLLIDIRDNLKGVEHGS